MIDRLEKVYYPFFFSIYVVLSFYAHNIDHVTFLIPFFTILVNVIITAGLFFLLNIFIKNKLKAGLILGLILVLFFSYGHLHGFLLEFVRDKIFFRDTKRIRAGVEAALNLHLILLIFYTLTLFLFTWLIIKKKTFDINKIINLLTLVLIGTVIFDIIRYNLSSGKVKQTDVQANIYNASAPEVKRDIYYIILDGYGRADYLQKYFDYNNEQFINFLRSKDFYVANKSRSNYGSTFLSLPSSLNVNYLDQVGISLIGTKSKDIRILFDKIKNNHVSRVLKDMGYKYVHFKSTWTATESNKNADIQIGLSSSFLTNNEFLRVFMETTLIKVFNTEINGSLGKSHLYSLEELKKIPEIKEPTFTFYHVLMPHHPFIFDKDGNILENKNKYNQFFDSDWGRGEAYIDQLIFVNKKITEAINIILKKSEIPPIIILQSDHGPRRIDQKREDYIDIRLGNLNALYFPGKSKKIFYDTMTPVNNFRLLFNEYFNANYPILEDHSFISEDSTPYYMTEIK